MGDSPREINLPPPLGGWEVPSFAHHTISHRLPKIAHETLAGLKTETNGGVPGEITNAIVSLAEGMPAETVRPLLDRNAPDTELWEGYIPSYLGKSWLELPWFFAEMYFYRRMLEACGYYQPGWGEGRDPYTFSKRQGIEASLENTLTISNFVAELKPVERTDHQAPLQKLLLASLWGNQADLSMWAAGEGPGNVKSRRYSAATLKQGGLIVDQSERVSEILAEGLQQVDIVLDNSGPELMADLELVDYILSNGLVEQVVLHAKAYPTFVSDATRADVIEAFKVLMDTDYPVLQNLGSRLEVELRTEKLRITPRDNENNFYWHSPDPFWNCPRKLETELMKPGLLIFKGDANFRRLLGDRHWKHTTPLDAIVGLRPIPRRCSTPPLLALRVC